MRRFTVTAALLVMTACELTRSPTAITLTDDRVMVQSVLVAGDTMARVLIRLVPAETNPGGPGPIDSAHPVSDAAVRLIAGADTVELRARTDIAENPCIAGSVLPQTPAGELLPGCYFGIVPGHITVGSTYRLLIDLPGRARVTGTTTVPHAVELISPDSGTHVLNGAVRTPPPLQVAWTPALPGQRTELAADAEGECAAYVALSSLVYTTSIDVSGATERSVRLMLSCHPAPDYEVPGAILVTVYDTAYARYVHAVENNHRLEEASAGLSGPAIGAFGSVTTARRPVLFVPE